jgi:hypothetical protein
MNDPLRITWYTSTAQGPISSDTLSVKINFSVPVDSISWSQSTSSDPNIGCFKVRLHNGNKDKKALDGLLLTVVNSSMIFSSAETIPQWSLTTTDFPSSVVGYSGGPLGPGGVTEDFSVCVNVQAFSARPLTIPVAWRSFANGIPVTSDTVRLVLTGASGSQCDTVATVPIDNIPGVCSFGFRVVNLHIPPSRINEMRFRLANGKGKFSAGVGVGTAAGWTQVVVGRDTVLFRGDSLESNESAEAFIVRLDSTEGTPVRIEACTRYNGVAVCCSEVTLQCGTAGIAMEDYSGNIDLIGIHPNPARSSAEIRLALKERADVELMIHDATGKMVHSERYRDVATGEQRLLVDLNELPAGAYHYTIHTQSGDLSGWMVVVR